MPPFLRRPLPLAAGLFLAVTLGHFLTLPLLIPWDGQDYIDLADVLDSARFPADWRPIRVPLLPFALKLSFALFGRSALAAGLVPLAMAALGCLLMADSVRRLAGEGAAAATLAVLALYPSLIAFEHAVLTETGTFFFLALALRLSLWTPETPRAAWLKAAGLALCLGAGYFWRQSLLLLAPWFALLHAAFQARERRRWPAAILQALLIVALPWGCKQAWLTHFDRGTMRQLDELVLRSFVVRQAVIPPDDARVDPSVREGYQAALARAGALWGSPGRRSPGSPAGSRRPGGRGAGCAGSAPSSATTRAGTPGPWAAPYCSTPASAAMRTRSRDTEMGCCRRPRGIR